MVSSVGPADPGEALVGEGFARDVRHDLGKIANAALVIDDAGLFAAGRAEADELHDSFPLVGCDWKSMSGWIGLGGDYASAGRCGQDRYAGNLAPFMAAWAA